jgi:hypothetical protein
VIACPRCHGPTDTRETRTVDDYVRRRRTCKRCGERITTIETIVTSISGHGFTGARLIRKRDLEHVKKIVDHALGLLPDEPIEPPMEGE